MVGPKHAGGGAVDNTLFAISGDDARHARVGLGRTLGNDTAQEMPTHGFDHGVAVNRRGEARPHGDDGRSHVARGTQIALGQNCVDHSRGLQFVEHLCLGVHHHGDIPRLGNLKRLGRRLRQASANALDLDLAQANGLAKTDCATDARGNRDIGHDN